MKLEGWLARDDEEAGGQIGFFIGPPPAVETPGEPVFFVAVEDDICSHWVDFQEADLSEFEQVLQPGTYCRATITIDLHGKAINPSA